jgi:hypothetical protein
MQAKIPAEAAGRTTVGKMVVELPLIRMVRNLQGTIAQDTVKNEYMLHKQWYEWMSAPNSIADLKAINERVYAEMFKTPSSDPWLGLAPPDVYAAIDNGGVVAVAARE